MSVPADVIVANYLEALASCPHPSAVVACVAGIGVGPGLELIERVLNARFAGSRVKVLPDYEAAWALAPDATDVVVIAGTGSVITSRDRHGYRVSGGRGLRDGDPGSAVKLGRLLLEERRFPVAADSQRGPARFAGVLTAAAEEGASWACRIVDREMQALALQLKQHVRESRRRTPIRVVIAGGVFESNVARDAFAVSLGASFDLTALAAVPVEGALQLAQKLLDRDAAGD